MKKKLQTRFPATRIKKIMQTDEDVGKIAMAVPLLISKALELFLQDLCNSTYDVTISRGAKTVNSFHLKQCVHEFNVFDFLRDIVNKVPDLGSSEAEDRSVTKRRKVVEDVKTTRMNEVEHTGGGRGMRGCGRTGSGESRDLEDVSPKSSRSPSHDDDDDDDDASCKKVMTHKNHNNLEIKVRNFDLNVGLDENGDSATSVERRLEGSSLGWPSMGMNEMNQYGSGNEEDYDQD